jgi:hypothetical protein
MQFDPNLNQLEAEKKSKIMYNSTKVQRKNGVWTGGSESEMFASLENIIKTEYPKTPVLESRVTSCLEPKYVSNDVC